MWLYMMDMAALNPSGTSKINASIKKYMYKGNKPRHQRFVVDYQNGALTSIHVYHIRESMAHTLVHLLFHRA